MSRLLTFAAIVGAAVLAGASSGAAAPVTKQNGSTPVFSNFTSICSVPGYADYGLCNGSTTTFSNVTGKINAVQAKDGRWNLGISFLGLQPGAMYRLWGNQDGAPPTPGVYGGFFIVGTGVADAKGKLSLSYQTTTPTNLGFDLNLLAIPDQFINVTIVTSYWSQQAIKVLDTDGDLYVPH